MSRKPHARPCTLLAPDILGRTLFFGYITHVFHLHFMNLSVKLIFVFVAVVCLHSPLRAQISDAESQLRLAQSFEQSGDWDRAVVLYERLHQAELGSEVYFEGLQRAYVHVRAFDKAIGLVEERLKVQPFNIGLLAVLGGIYYESGSAQQADSVWNRLIQTDPKNTSLYRLVASQMIEHRLFPQAVTTYLAGRKAAAKDDLFADDLATLYTFLQQYDAAASELIKLLNAYPQQLPFIETRIASFTIRDAGLLAATGVTRNEVRSNPDNVTLRRLYAWLAMEGHNYGAALEEFKVIDRLSNSDGAELLGFARRASREGSDLVASEAFHDVIGLSRNIAYVSQARFGYARSMEDLSAESDSSNTSYDTFNPTQDVSTRAGVSETKKGFQSVLQLYDSIIKDFPNSELAAQAFYRIGIIRMDHFADYSGSLESFQKAKAIARNLDLSGDVSSKIAEVYILQNNLTPARAEYQAMVQLPIPAYQEMARFRIAELDYFEGKFDTSLVELKPLTSNLRSDLSNDALLLQYFISENKGTNTSALTDYVRADLLMREKKYSEALARFAEIVSTYPTALLVDNATMKIGELHLLLNQVQEGLGSFLHLVDDMPESILRDRAQMKIAETYQRMLKDKEKAIAAYEKILSKFPNSLYVELARKRIRQLRGDAS